MRFAEFLAEGKQVGVIYHFTGFQNAWGILSDQQLKADTDTDFYAVGGGFVFKRARDGVSFTRNHDLRKTANTGGKEGEIWAAVRIAFDGNKLSNKHKIEPVVDVDNHITRHDQQAEEIIKKNIVKFNASDVKQVDVIMSEAVKERLVLDSRIDDPDQGQIEKEKIEAAEYIGEFVKWVKGNGYKVNVVDDFRRPVR